MEILLKIVQEWKKITNTSTTTFIHSNKFQKLFLGKGILDICSQFTGVQPCRYFISIKLHYNFIEITPLLGCSPVNLLHTFRTPFPKNISGGLRLKFALYLNRSNRLVPVSQSSHTCLFYLPTECLKRPENNCDGIHFF